MATNDYLSDQIERRSDKLESQMQVLQAEIVRLQGEMTKSIDEVHSSIGNTRTAITNVDKQLEQTRQTQQILKQRVPPLAQTGAAVVAVLAILGFSYSELRESAQGVASIKPQAETAVRSLTQGASNLSTVAGNLQTQQGSLIRDLQDGQAEVKELASSLEQLRGDVAKVRQTMLQLLTKAASLGNPSGRRGGSFPRIKGVPEGLHIPALALMEAHRLTQSGDHQGALDALEHVPATSDSDESVARLIVEANAHRGLNQFEQAVGCFANALDILKKSTSTPTAIAAAWNNLGSTYYAWGLSTMDADERKEHLQQSHAAINKARAIKPDSPEITTNLMITLTALAQPQAALEARKSFEGDVPPQMRIATAAALAKSGQTADALEELIAIGDAVQEHALSIAIDDDFESLRSNPAFLSFLQPHIEPTWLETITDDWKPSVVEASSGR